MRALGTTTVEVKSGYGLTVDDEVRSLRLAGEVTDETTFLGAHVVPPGGARRPGGLPRPRLRADAGGVRAVRPLGRRLLRARLAARLHRGRGAARARGRAGCRARPARARQPALGRAGRAARRRARGRERRPLHLPHRADVEALVGAAGTTVATLLPGVEFSTRSPYPDARRLLDAGGRPRAGDRLQPRHLQHGIHAVRHRARRARDADDGGRGARGGHRGGARALRRTDVGRVPWGRAPTWPCSRRRRTSTWPTGPGCRSPAPSTSAEPASGGQTGSSRTSEGRWPDDFS